MPLKPLKNRDNPTDAELLELVRRLLYYAVYAEQTAEPIARDRLSDDLLVAVEEAERELGEDYVSTFAAIRREMLRRRPGRKPRATSGATSDPGR